MVVFSFITWHGIYLYFLFILYNLPMGCDLFQSYNTFTIAHFFKVLLFKWYNSIIITILFSYNKSKVAYSFLYTYTFINFRCIN